eukprot:TRINITY_DN4357_c0_g1_i1.p1 TRINITY_DN4357_c0_g1~~TRINITY_DN4357_c0_g1_i1.p1  ORF type:complete len:138 (-),score=23.81 TRINITY_DN4357_c0_g1_i1:34-390(-)
MCIRDRYMGALPFVIVLGFPLMIAVEVMQSCRPRRPRYRCIYEVISFPFFLLVGLCLNLIVVPIVLVGSIPVGTFFLIKHIRERRRERQRIRRLVAERLNRSNSVSYTHLTLPTIYSV